MKGRTCCRWYDPLRQQGRAARRWLRYGTCNLPSYPSPVSFLFFFFWNIDPISLWLNSWRDCIGALHFSDCRRRRSSRKLRVSWPSSSPIRNPANRPKRKRPSQVSHFVYVFFLSFILLSGTKQKCFRVGVARMPSSLLVGMLMLFFFLVHGLFSLSLSTCLSHFFLFPLLCLINDNTKNFNPECI